MMAASAGRAAGDDQKEASRKDGREGQGSKEGSEVTKDHCDPSRGNERERENRRC